MKYRKIIDSINPILKRLQPWSNNPYLLHPIVDLSGTARIVGICMGKTRYS
jgi:hypothetical protein